MCTRCSAHALLEVMKNDQTKSSETTKCQVKVIKCLFFIYFLEVFFLVPVLILSVNIWKCDFQTIKLLCKLWATHTVPVLQILIHVGFLTEESGDVFSPKVLKGGPLGEMVQWADILTALHVLGHNLKISMSVKELQGWVPEASSVGFYCSWTCDSHDLF